MTRSCRSRPMRSRSSNTASRSWSSRAAGHLQRQRRLLRRTPRGSRTSTSRNARPALDQASVSAPSTPLGGAQRHQHRPARAPASRAAASSVGGPRVLRDVGDDERLARSPPRGPASEPSRRNGHGTPRRAGARRRPRAPARRRTGAAPRTPRSAPAISRARSATRLQRVVASAGRRAAAGDLRRGRQPPLAGAPPPRRAARSRWPRRRPRPARPRTVLVLAR